jgi:hypothetical protein
MPADQKSKPVRRRQVQRREIKRLVRALDPAIDHEVLLTPG